MSINQIVVKAPPTAVHPSAVKQYCPAAEAQSPRRWQRVGSPHRCPEEVCWCGRPPARTWTLCCLRATSRWGTAGRMTRSRRASRGWRARQGRQQPQCKHPRGRAGQGWESAEREGGEKNVWPHCSVFYTNTKTINITYFFLCSKFIDYLSAYCVECCSRPERIATSYWPEADFAVGLQRTTI